MFRAFEVTGVLMERSK